MVLTADQLRKTYDSADLLPEDLANHRPLKAIIGQDRAVKALRFGLGNRAPGFNIYLSGVPGEGKIDAVLHFLEDLARREPPPQDWCYVNNFEDPYYPKRLSLPQGKAKELRTDVGRFVEEAQLALVKAFESEEYANKIEEIKLGYQELEKELYEKLNQKAKNAKFTINRTPVEVIAVPLVEGRPMMEKEFYALPEEERKRILDQQAEFKTELKAIARRLRELEKEFQGRAYELEQRVALFSIEALLDELHEKYDALPEVIAYLDAIKQHMLDDLSGFLQPNEQAKGAYSQPKKQIPRAYEVNVLIDNSALEGAPIVLELNPTYNNLFGKVEKESYMGALMTDFTLIRAGSLHQANGGYIVLPVEELLRNYFSWESLKRALRNRELVVEDAGERYGFIATKGLKPEPVPLDVQVILIGRPQYYYLLYELDDDFQDLFKVKADFDTSMEPSPENLRDYMGFLNQLCREEGLLPFDASGMAAMLEYGHRLAGHQRRISTEFGIIADLVQEANHYARKEGADRIGSAQVKEAFREKVYRASLLQEKILDYIEQGVILLDLEGARVGQLNGLSVLQLGDTAFGRPTRITASVGVGGAGILDIEREAKLGGPIHTKGVLILSGFLTQLFGRENPLGLSARLVFEQSYSEVEGDSASSAELYALLSALSDIPLRQSIAVTGSVDQRGQVQAVGGINEKIEGFFAVCQAAGLTGEQGVMIPAGNLSDLMLREEVVEAVRQGQFHVWAVADIAEGIELLTGLPAGAPLGDWHGGAPHFDEGSVFERADRRLQAMAEKAQLSLPQADRKAFNPAL